MKHVDHNVYFKCDCESTNANYCSHIVGVILKISLTQVTKIGMDCNTESVMKMFKNMNI